jgi:hypothetical protein
MEQNRRCDICNIEISKTNWSKHIKTKKHLDAVQARREVNERSDEEIQIKRCGICNIDVQENVWIKHLKSLAHKKNTKLLQNKFKKKIKSFNIIKQRRRDFNDVDFETDDYIVKKSEEALEGCFLTLRIIPKNDINSVNVLKEELPELMFERMKDILEHKTSVKFQIVLRGKFRKFIPALAREEFEELTIVSKNQIILRVDEIKETIIALLTEIHEKIESWDNNEGNWQLKNVINIQCIPKGTQHRKALSL